MFLFSRMPILSKDVGTGTPSPGRILAINSIATKLHKGSKKASASSPMQERLSTALACTRRSKFLAFRPCEGSPFPAMIGARTQTLCSKKNSFQSDPLPHFTTRSSIGHLCSLFLQPTPQPTSPVRPFFGSCWDLPSPWSPWRPSPWDWHPAAAPPPPLRWTRSSSAAPGRGTRPRPRRAPGPSWDQRWEGTVEATSKKRGSNRIEARRVI